MDGVRQAAVALSVVGGVLTVGLVLAALADKGRGPVPILGATVQGGGRELELAVSTCHGEPEAEVTSQDDARVVIRVVSDVQTGDNNACADGVTVRLNRALGDRELIDATSGNRIGIRNSG